MQGLQCGLTVWFIIEAYTIVMRLPSYRSMSRLGEILVSDIMEDRMKWNIVSTSDMEKPILIKNTSIIYNQAKEVILTL